MSKKYIVRPTEPESPHPRAGSSSPRGNRLGQAAQYRAGRRGLAAHYRGCPDQAQATLPATSREMY